MQVIAGDHQAKAEAAKRQVRECQALLDRMVRPAVREARKALAEISRVECGEGAEPFIRVKRDLPKPDELRYRCTGAVLEVWTTRGGYSDDLEFPLASVSRELVDDQVERFLRDALAVAEEHEQ